MTELIDDVDKAAGELLKRAMASDKNEDGTPTLVTLAERTKAFDSVVEWAKVRHGLVPQEKTPSKFEQIRGDFNGAGTRKTNKRRGVADKVETAEGQVDGGDAGLNGTDGLFAS